MPGKQLSCDTTLLCYLICCAFSTRLETWCISKQRQQPAHATLQTTHLKRLYPLPESIVIHSQHGHITLQIRNSICYMQITAWATGAAGRKRKVVLDAAGQRWQCVRFCRQPKQGFHHDFIWCKIDAAGKATNLVANSKHTCWELVCVAMLPQLNLHMHMM